MELVAQNFLRLRQLACGRPITQRLRRAQDSFGLRRTIFWVIEIRPLAGACHQWAWQILP